MPANHRGTRQNLTNNLSHCVNKKSTKGRTDYLNLYQEINNLASNQIKAYKYKGNTIYYPLDKQK